MRSQELGFRTAGTSFFPWQKSSTLKNLEEPEKNLFHTSSILKEHQKYVLSPAAKLGHWPCQWIFSIAPIEKTHRTHRIPDRNGGFLYGCYGYPLFVVWFSHTTIERKPPFRSGIAQLGAGNSPALSCPQMPRVRPAVRPDQWRKPGQVGKSQKPHGLVLFEVTLW